MAVPLSRVNCTGCVSNAQQIKPYSTEVFFTSVIDMRTGPHGRDNLTFYHHIRVEDLSLEMYYARKFKAVDSQFVKKLSGTFHRSELFELKQRE